MAKRSLTVSSPGKIVAKRAFERKGITQSDLAIEVGLSTRQSVWKFFAGKPVDKNTFIEICHFLDLNWEEIVDLPSDNLTSQQDLPDAKVENQPPEDIQAIKLKINPIIENQCATLNYVDMRQIIDLNSLYTELNVFPYISKEQWVQIPSQQDLRDIKDGLNSQQISEGSVPAPHIIQQHSHLLIFGKPGSGKTTLLQNITYQCQNNQIFPQLVPIFIRLNLLFFNQQQETQIDIFKYIEQQWQFIEISRQKIEELFKQGSLLLLFDGLDEIPPLQQKIFLQSIQSLLLINPITRVLITSRTMAANYSLDNFIYVEIADYNFNQIEIFVNKWFKHCSLQDPNLSNLKNQELLQLLQLPKNQPIKELIKTPIFINLICSIFQSHGSLPNKRAKIYQIGLDILLKRRDEAIVISHSQSIVYQKLSLADKIRLLTDIAYQTFCQNKYLFEKLEIIKIISEFIISNYSQPMNREQLFLESEIILDSIEEHYGLLVQKGKEVYSFSHLTFQEYLTARKIANAETEELILDYLEKINIDLTQETNKEVIILSIEMSFNARPIVHSIQNYLDLLLNNTPELIELLALINYKVKKINSEILPSALRGFYLGLFLDRDFSLAVSIDITLASTLPEELALDLTLSRLLNVCEEILDDFSLSAIMNLSLFLDLETKYNLDLEFQKEFIKLKQQILIPGIEKTNLEVWWQDYGRDWINSLKELIITHRYYGNNCQQFEVQDLDNIRQYYLSNLFLIECLNHAENLDQEYKDELIENLLSPVLTNKSVK